MIGIRECNQFFQDERDNTMIRGITMKEFLITNELKPYVKRYLDKYEDTEYYRRKAYALYYSSLSNFRPSEAIKLYRKANSKSVLDPCAGWGGRCYGAMEYGANYIGFDTNINLKEPYDNFITTYNKGNKKIEIHFEDSAKVDYSKYQYDTVLTSPPYYKREPYNNMPSYKSPKEFYDKFLQPMISNSYKFLSIGGYYYLNVPQKMYETVVNIIGRECDEAITYRKIKRNTTDYSEYVYLWIRTS